MGLSITKYLWDGSTTDYSLNFALGYTGRDTVSAFISGENPVSLPFDWIDADNVRITDTSNLEVGSEINFARTVSKTDSLVDFTQPGSITRQNINDAMQHTLRALHELLDGRYGGVSEVDEAVFARVDTSVAAALQNFLFRSDFRRDLLLDPDLTQPSTVTYTSGSVYGDSSEALIFVETPPSEEIEVSLYNNSQVILSFTIDTDGTFSTTDTGPFELQPGAVQSAVTGAKYASGATVKVVLPVRHSSVVDFDVELSDYTALFQAAAAED